MSSTLSRAILVWTVGLMLLLGLGPVGRALGQTTDLDTYVNITDTGTPEFEEVEIYEGDPGYTTYVYALDSLQWTDFGEIQDPEDWQLDPTVGNDWSHYVAVRVPDTVDNTTALLILIGDIGEVFDPEKMGWPTPSNSVVAVVTGIPNSPITFGDEPEDPRSGLSILAKSFDNYIDEWNYYTDLQQTPPDSRWPALLPMVKSVTIGMDVIQTAEDEYQQPRFDIDDFVVTGYSQWGWTSALTGAVDDRVSAVLPCVMDGLMNADENFRHANKTMAGVPDDLAYYNYRGFSYLLDDFTDEGTFDEFDTPAGQALQVVVDPHEYFDRDGTGGVPDYEALPKFFTAGTADPWWPTDTMQFFVDDLLAANAAARTAEEDQINYFLREPNDGHHPAPESVMNPFYKAIAEDDLVLPTYWWVVQADGSIIVYDDSDEGVELLDVRLWEASKDNNRRFTGSPTWTDTELDPEQDGSYIAEITDPDHGSFGAFLVKLTYDIDPESGPSNVTEAYFTTEARIIAPGDFTMTGRPSQDSRYGIGDGIVDESDMDYLATKFGNPDSRFDLTGDSSVDLDDHTYQVEAFAVWGRLINEGLEDEEWISGFGTTLGDINLDGLVDSADQAILTANLDQAGGYADGDLDGDGMVDSDDQTILTNNSGSAVSMAVYWTASSASAWSDNANWYWTEPTADESVFINNGGTVVITLTGEVCDRLTAGQFVGSSGTVDMNGGDLAAEEIVLGNYGSGTFDQSDGDVTTSGDLTLGRREGSDGAYTLSGGTLMVTDTLTVGADGTGRFEWFDGTSGAFEADELALGSDGTLAMGFDFDVDELKSGALFGSGTMTGLGSGTLEITNAATATHDTGTFDVGTLTIGSTDGTGRYEWFYNTGDGLTADEIVLASNGTLAMGFNFALDELADGTLFGNGTMTDLNAGTLEITKEATATHDSGTSVTVGALQIGSSDGDGRLTVTGTDTTLNATSITVTNDGDTGGNDSSLWVHPNTEVNVTNDIDLEVGAKGYFQSGGEVTATNMTATGTAVSHNGGDLALSGDLTISGGTWYTLNLGGGSGDLAVTGDINIVHSAGIGALFAWGSNPGGATLSADTITLSGYVSGYIGAPTLGMAFDFDLDELTDGSLFGGTLVGLDTDGELLLANGTTATHDTGSETIKIVKIGAYGTGPSDATYAISSTAALNTDYMLVADNGLGTLEIQSTTADITVAELLYFGSGGNLSITSADGTITMDSADFDNKSTTASNLADLDKLELIFEGDPVSTDKFEVAGDDVGAEESGFSDNFALGELAVGGTDDGWLTLFDDFDNQDDGQTYGEALYVDTLTVLAGSTLDLDDFNLYYHYITNNGTVDETGGGSLYWVDPGGVPEPATMGLLAMGGLAMLRRRKK